MGLYVETDFYDTGNPSNITIRDQKKYLEFQHIGWFPFNRFFKRGESSGVKRPLGRYWLVRY